MQAIARVNRVFKDKPGGLVVDYLGLADDLRKALATYTESGGRGEAAVNQDEAVAVMLERYEVCRDMFHRFDYAAYFTGSADDKMRMLPAAQEHILGQPDGKERFIKAVVELSKAFALSVPRPEALDIRDEVAFFQTVKAALAKTERGKRRSEEDLDHAIRQIVAEAIAPEGVIDIFRAAGLQKPDISILSEEFLAEVREMPHRNLAVELLQRGGGETSSNGASTGICDTVRILCVRVHDEAGPAAGAGPVVQWRRGRRRRGLAPAG
jgi:type I restriction enzyme R subunit